MDGARAVPLPAHLLLRESTRDAHEAAEASAGMRHLLSGELDEAGYRRLLAAQWGLFREWEDERGEWLESVVRMAGWNYVSRADPLGRDVLDTVIAAEAAPTQDLPRTCVGATQGLPRSCVGAASAAISATAWGELYVVEGSALGGRLIVRHLRERFPRLPHHFYAIGEHATPPWRRFQAILDTALTDDGARQAAVAGALTMFARFQQTLQDDPRHG